MNATTSKGKLLLIDDDEMNGMLLKKRLNKRGFECEYVQSADECFEVLNQQQFDLVLLDIIMPRVSGIDVLVQIRKQKNNFELPVIMVTAKDEASDVVEALKKGANDYITKPVNMEIAEARIKTQLKIKTQFAPTTLITDCLRPKLKGVTPVETR